MNASSVVLVILTLVLLLWIGLSITRTATTRYFQKVSAAYDTYYQANRSEAGEMPPPARWDFGKGKLVPIPPEEIAVDSSSVSPDPEHSFYPEAQQMQVHLVREGEAAPAPFWVLGLAFGKKLARISPLLFHGGFAALAIGLGVIALKLRM